MKASGIVPDTQKVLSTFGNDIESDLAFLLHYCIECLINQSAIKM